MADVDKIHTHSKQSDSKKRKSSIGSAEKEHKQYRSRKNSQSHQNGQMAQEGYMLKEARKDYSVYVPREQLSIEKKDVISRCSFSPEQMNNLSWGDRMEMEENQAQQPKRPVKQARKKLPLTERSSNRPVKVIPVETDPNKLLKRQKQLDIGKNTPGYTRYVASVPRKKRTPDHPWTPNKHHVCSTRSWQGLVRIWRRKLHFWDPPHVQLDFERTHFNTEASATFEKLTSTNNENRADWFFDPKCQQSVYKDIQSKTERNDQSKDKVNNSVDIVDPDHLSNSSGSRSCSQSSTGDEYGSIPSVSDENELLEYTEDELLFGNLGTDGVLEDLVFS